MGRDMKVLTCKQFVKVYEKVSCFVGFCVYVKPERHNDIKESELNYDVEFNFKHPDHDKHKLST